MMERRKLLAGLAALPLAQIGNAGQFQQPRRRPAVPLAVIEKFRLRPSDGYGLYLLGEDGRPYSFDDVVTVLFEMSAEHWRPRK